MVDRRLAVEGFVFFMSRLGARVMTSCALTEQLDLSRFLAVTRMALVTANDCGVDHDEMTDAAIPSREAAYQQFKEKVFHLCLRFGCGNVAWAEDVTHDVFVKVLENYGQIVWDDAGGWIYRVTVNTCLSRLRRENSLWRRVQTKLVAWSAMAERRPTTPQESVLRSAQAAELLDALDALSPLERTIFSMRYLDQVSQTEICRTLSLSKGYVSKVLARARVKVERHADL